MNRLSTRAVIGAAIAVVIGSSAVAILASGGSVSATHRTNGQSAPAGVPPKAAQVTATGLQQSATPAPEPLTQERLRQASEGAWITVPPPATTENGPLSAQLIQDSKQLLPHGAAILTAKDFPGETPMAMLDYQLPGRQRLSIVRETFKLPLPADITPQNAITNPATDSVQQLNSGAWLARLGHAPGSSQVMLLKPDGTLVNVTFTMPFVPNAGGPVIDSSTPPAFTLDTLAAAVEQVFGG